MKEKNNYIDISDKKIKVAVRFLEKDTPSIGTIHDVYVGEDGNLHIYTLIINGELWNRAGLKIAKL